MKNLMEFSGSFLSDNHPLLVLPDGVHERDLIPAHRGKALSISFMLMIERQYNWIFDQDTAEISPIWVNAYGGASRSVCCWLAKEMCKVLNRPVDHKRLAFSTEKTVLLPMTHADLRAALGLPAKSNVSEDVAYLRENLDHVATFIEMFHMNTCQRYADYVCDVLEGRSLAASSFGEVASFKVTSLRRKITLRAEGSISIVGLGGQSQQQSCEQAAPKIDESGRVVALQREMQELRARLDMANAESARFAEEAKEQRSNGVAAQYRDEISSLRGRIRWLETSRKAAGIDDAALIEIPDKWEALPSFAADHLGGRVIITKRAIRAVRDSVFANIPFAYEVLLMLAHDYVPMRQGEPGARARFEETCKKLRVEVCGAGEAVTSHVTSDAYRIQYRGKRLPLDLHVSGSNNRDPKIGFRLYFHYVDDGDDGVVVVGHLPSHLENSLS